MGEYTGAGLAVNAAVQRLCKKWGTVETLGYLRDWVAYMDGMIVIMENHYDKGFWEMPGTEGQEQQEELARLAKAADTEKSTEAAKLLLTAIKELEDEGGEGITVTEITRPSNEQIRSMALDCALNYHNKREGTPAKVVETAAVFYAYIMNGGSA